MYETILVLKYGLYKKTPAGSIAVYNNNEPRVKVISGMSEADCEAKVEQFFSEAEFVPLKGAKHE